MPTHTKNDPKKLELDKLFFPKEPAARVRLAMAIVSNILAHLDKKPTSTKPLSVCGTADIIPYVWTAAVFFGQKGSKFQYQSDCVRYLGDLTYVRGRIFFPREQFSTGILGLFPTFTKESLFEAEFKPHLTDDMLVITRSPRAYECVSVEDAQNKGLEEQSACALEFEEQKPEAVAKRNAAKQIEEEEQRALLRKQEEDKARERSRQQELIRKQEKLRQQEEARLFEEAREHEDIKRHEQIKQQEIARAQQASLLAKQEQWRQETNMPLEQVDEQRKIRVKEKYQKPLLKAPKALEEKVNLEQQKGLLHRLLAMVRRIDPPANLLDVIDFIKKENFKINVQDDAGYTFLMRMLVDHREDIAEYLIIHEQANPFLKAANGLTALDLVSRSAPIYDLMMDYEEQFKPEITPSHHLNRLVRSGKATILDIESLLLKGAEIDFQDESDGCTLLIIAASQQADIVCDFLLERGANPLKENHAGAIARDYVSKSSPLCERLKNKEQEWRRRFLSQQEQYNLSLQDYVSTAGVKILKLEEYFALGADVDYQNAEGNTALMLALDASNDQAAEHLLKNGANPFIKNKYNKKAGDLISRNAPIYRILKGYELLSAVLAGDLLYCESLLKADPTIINFQGKDGYTALLIAGESNIVEMVMLLLEHGADSTIANDEGQNILDMTTDDSIKSLFLSKEEEQESPISDPEKPSPSPKFFHKG